MNRILLVEDLYNPMNNTIIQMIKYSLGPLIIETDLDIEIRKLPHGYFMVRVFRPTQPTTV